MSATSKGARAPRISKADAMDRFIGAVIELLATHPIAEISDQLIADTAGINRASIYRYFSTHDQLLDAVLERLTTSWNDEAAALTAEREARGEGHGGFAISARLLPYSRPAFDVMAYLVARSHHSPELTSSLEVFVGRWEGSYETVGMTPRMARAFALKSLAVMFSRSALVGVLDLPDTAVDDMQALLFAEIINQRSIAEGLGWDVE